MSGTALVDAGALGEVKRCAHDSVSQTADRTAFRCADCGATADSLSFGPDGHFGFNQS